MVGTTAFALRTCRTRSKRLAIFSLRLLLATRHTLRALALTSLAPRRVRPVVGALAAFIIVAILAPAVLLIHEMLSLGAVWVTVFFAIVPVAPLALVLLQAGSRRTARGAGTTSGAAPSGTPVAGQVATTV